MQIIFTLQKFNIYSFVQQSWFTSWGQGVMRMAWLIINYSCSKSCHRNLRFSRYHRDIKFLQCLITSADSAITCAVGFNSLCPAAPVDTERDSTRQHPVRASARLHAVPGGRGRLRPAARPADTAGRRQHGYRIEGNRRKQADQMLCITCSF